MLFEFSQVCPGGRSVSSPLSWDFLWPGSSRCARRLGRPCEAAERALVSVTVGRGRSLVERRMSLVSARVSPWTCGPARPSRPLCGLREPALCAQLCAVLQTGEAMWHLPDTRLTSQPVRQPGWCWFALLLVICDLAL